MRSYSQTPFSLIFGHLGAWLVFLTVLTLAPLPAAATPLSEMAKPRLEFAWNSAETALENVTDSSLPHEVDRARVELCRLRDELDLFAPAYDDKPDRWQKARQLVDRGCEAISAFAELYDRQLINDPLFAVYRADELNERRVPLREWQGEWQTRQDGLREDMEHPREERFTERSIGDLSRFFWGVGGLEPREEKSGEANLARLAARLMEKADDAWPALSKIGNLAGRDEEDAIREFLKRLGAIARLLDSTPEILSGASSAERVATLDQLVEMYGRINVRISARRAADDRGDGKTAKLMAEQITQMWDHLRGEQEKIDLPQFLAKITGDLKL